MPHQKAVVIDAPGQAKLVSDRPWPSLRDDYILVKTMTVALNPTDWKHVDFLPCPGVLVGCDYAGVVEEVGSKVTKAFKKGDRVCGFVHGANAVQPEDGAFAEMIVAKGDLQIVIPENISFAEAATLGVGVTTVGQALYQSLKLALPTEPVRETVSVLIYGGSTATGSLAIQYAKLSGYQVVTTCSPQHHAWVKELGADVAVDYHAPTSASQIRQQTQDKLFLVLDTISTEASAQYCGEAMSTQGGAYTALSGVKVPRDNVTSNSTMAYTAIGEKFRFGDAMVFPACEKDYHFSECFWTLSHSLLAQGKIRPHPQKVCEGGLGGILEGLEQLKGDKISGMKLVYNIA